MAFPAHKVQQFRWPFGGWFVRLNPFHLEKFEFNGAKLYLENHIAI